MSLLEVKSFLKNIKPFNGLGEDELLSISSNLDIVYFKENETVFEKNGSALFLYFIIKGVVEQRDEDELISVYENSEFFDPVSLIENKLKYNFVTLQETICYALSRELFLDTIYQNEKLERYFFLSISQKLNANIQNEQNKKLPDFAVAKVEDAYLQKPVYVNHNDSIHGTVVKINQNNAHCALVKKENGEVGIVTDSDFVNKALLDKIDINSPVSTISSFGLVYIDALDFLFNAQLLLAKHGLKRLIVKKENEIVGILDILALNSFFASHSSSTSRLIDSAVSIEELKKASEQFIKTIRTLYEKGVKVRYISKLISTLNEKLFTKLFELTAPEDLKGSSCLIIMGSEGRGEQILRTDQDNGLIISDSCTLSKDQIKEFTDLFTKHLISLGYPKCDGDIMISNPFWTKTQKEYKDTIFNWIHDPKGDNFMNLAIFYDAVAVCGKKELLAELKEYLFNISEHTPAFYSFFAQPTLSFETPLGFFSDFILDKDKHKDEFDIKKGGIFP
ncbi:MAG: DUF294 nucleotidyltransferase-like domain-containing protein, partial [Campylobacterota bacterium]|nr:DUF294 nucleotidyltransferase-like domain-containing protein [Campylobacterota bacterium]